MIDEASVRCQYELLRPSLDERGRRLFAASQVRALGYGGLSLVARATGMAPSTIGRGLKELDQGATRSDRQRRPGGGRKRLVESDATLESDLLSLIGPMTLGCPERPLLLGFRGPGEAGDGAAQHGTHGLGQYGGPPSASPRLQPSGNAKANEGRGHPDRDAQFDHINARVLEFSRRPISR